MSSFFGFLSTFLWCGTLFGLASIVALSMPQSRFRTVLNEALSWASVALCAFYVVSPIDFLPEAALGPVGCVDDLGALYMAFLKVKDALKLRRQRREQENLA